MEASQSAAPVEFEAELRADDATSGTFIEVPDDVRERLGVTGRAPVRMLVNGIEYRGSLVKYAGRFMVGVPKAIRSAADASAGDIVSIALEIDSALREVDVPPELEAALAADKLAAAGWETLSYSHRREWAMSVADAKRPETRETRVAAAVEALRVRAMTR